MASAVKEDNLPDAVEAIVFSFTESTTVEECRKLYADWAPTYERDVDTCGYTLIKPFAETFDSSMKKCFGEQRKTMKILDVGAGTGLVGADLRGRGYTHVDALDACQEMLDVAKEKNIYRKYICAAVGEEPVSEIGTGEYDGLISCGTLLNGHIRPVALQEMVRQVKSGGLITLSLRKDRVENQQNLYARAIENLSEDKKWEMVSKDLSDYMINPTLPKEVNECYILVFKVV